VEYGGLGLNYLDHVIAMEEISRACGIFSFFPYFFSTKKE
jgi:alkylation response protein AidB-like acyl-CoA dehydrogenase